MAGTLDELILEEQKKQILDRELNDDELFASSCIKLVGAVMGRQFGQALLDNQRETKDAMDAILKYYHHSAVTVPDSVTDADEQLTWICRATGLMYRRVRLTEGWQKDAVGPMLGLFRESGKPVELLPNSFSGYSFRDPSGKMCKVDADAAALFEDDAVCFYAPFPAKKLTYKELGAHILGRISRVDFIWLLSMLAAVTLVGLLMPQLNHVLFSDVYMSGSVQMLIGIALFMVCQAVSQAVFRAVQNGFMMKIQQKLNLDVQAAAMIRLLTLPAGFFHGYSSGDLQTRMSMVPLLCNTLVRVTLSTGIPTLFSLLYIVQISAIAPALLVPSVVIIGAMIAFVLVSTRLQIRVSREQMKLEARENALSYAMITGIQKIRLAGAERRFFGRWAELYAQNAGKLYNPPRFLRLSQTINLAITLFGTLWLYASALNAGISVADFFAFNTAYGMVFGAISLFSLMALEAAKIKPMLEMAEPILSAVPETGDDRRSVENISGGIELNNVCFRYNEESPWIVDGLSVKIRPRDYVAIVGKTGCGKTTLVRLLLGLEKPDRGAVYYDGRDLEGLELRSLRQKIGTVMQNGALFIGSIRDNITANAPNLSEEEAWEAAEIAGIADDIRRLPMGMQTLVSEGSGGFSGGQKQRMLIARAIAPKPKILIFDEATSALDNITQKQVTEALDRFKCTRIVIAHRLSTIRSCNRILFLEGGKIVEDGSYDELMEKKGRFYDLVRRQQV